MSLTYRVGERSITYSGYCGYSWTGSNPTRTHTWRG